MPRKTIVLHDYFEAAEGGGRLSLVLARAWRTDLAYGFKAPDHPYFSASPFPQREYDLGVRTRVQGWRQFQLARAFAGRSRFLDDYDLAIYSGFYAPLAVQHHREGSDIYYCHTPPRFIYDQRDFYLGSLPKWQRPLLQALIRYIRPRYEEAVESMDLVLTNSENVRQRIKRHLGLEAKVVYPPCDTAARKWLGQGDFYLSCARLDPLKRVDRAVEAFLGMPRKKLVVVSGGPELSRIRKLAAGAGNIEIMGWVDEATLNDLLGRCIATVYIPRDEDFGMSPVESMAAGKPVIGVGGGGIAESVVAGETGLLLSADPPVEEVRQAVKEMTPERALAMRGACEERAARFDTAIFIERMRTIVERVGGHSVPPNAGAPPVVGSPS